MLASITIYAVLLGREGHPFCGEEDAGDLTQTVFLKVSRALHTFRGDSSLSTWISRIEKAGLTRHIFS